VQPFAAARSKLIPITLGLVGSLAVVGGTYYFSRSDGTPSADKVAANPVPPAGVVAPTNPDAMPEVKQQQPQQQVALTQTAPPLTQPTATSKPALPAATATAVVPAAAPTPPATVGLQPPATMPTPVAGAANLATARTLLASDPVGARLALTQLIDSRQLSPADEQAALQSIREVNAKLFFSPTVAPGDIVTKSYTVQSGDTLAKIARRSGVQADWRVIQRINGLKSEKSLRVGQTIKIPVTAFHAEVSKSAYIMRVYAGEGPTRVMIAAFPVGLGEFDSTPTGVFMVRPKSKLINPEWKNPRTGEHFAADDPKNPIGERWIGLLGVEAHNQGFKGIGIHGTVEPSSIGKQASMGCVRMGDSDVEMIYELLTEPNSTILIAP
jgi:lipoprotein-anchoring transpeptidase ErfK/SrfK